MAPIARLILLGFDGLDPRLCRRWMDAGVLPNLAKLAGSGSFEALNTSSPCQSPVAWRTLATGVNPGNHGVFDFLKKMPGTYLPEMATVKRGVMPVMEEDWKRFAMGGAVGVVGGLAAFGAMGKAKVSRRAFLGGAIGLPLAAGVTGALYSWLPKSVPLPENRTGGIPFWKTLGEAGVRCKVLRMPVEFPARDYENCQVLSGLGVPDIRATNGTYTLFAEDVDALEDTEMGGRIVPIRFAGGKAEAIILGPPNALAPEKGSLQCAFSVARDGEAITLRCGDERIGLKSGEWSPWLPIEFSASPLMGLQGKGRFHLLSLDPLRLYLAPVNFDPAALPPNIRIGSPNTFSSTLANRHGFYKTLGWPTDTWALNEEHIPDTVYLDDYRDTMATEKAITLAELEKGDWDCLTAIFTPTDQIQHVFRAGTERGDEALMAAYGEVDEFVGTVMKRFVDSKTMLVVLSDHGFHKFDKAVNLNTWLWKNGYLKFDGEVLPDAPPKKLRDLAEKGQFWEGVDWANTYAYSMGLGNIYLNLAGREPNGIVRSGAMANAVIEKLREGLRALRDPETGAPAIRSLYAGKEIYQGTYIKDAADLVVGFHDGYRVSWQTALGGTPEDIIEPNNRKWSGDHCSLDPATTPGVLFRNRPLATQPRKARLLGGGTWPSVMDVAPSLVGAFGIRVPEEMEGSELLSR